MREAVKPGDYTVFPKKIPHQYKRQQTCHFPGGGNTKNVFLISSVVS
jgi:hypothetical protein